MRRSLYAARMSGAGVAWICEAELEAWALFGGNQGCPVAHGCRDGDGRGGVEADGHDLLWPHREAVGWAAAEPLRFLAHQVGERGGELWCEDQGERVSMTGEAALFLEGRIRV